MSRLHYEQPNPYDLSPTPGMWPCEECGGEYYRTDIVAYGPRDLCLHCSPRCGHLYRKGLVLVKCQEPARFGSEGGFCLDCEIDAIKDELAEAVATKDKESIALYTEDLAELEALNMTQLSGDAK